MSGFSGKSILIVQGPGLATADLRAELESRGATAIVATDVATAFSLIGEFTFDGALIDRALQNEAFDFCTELQALYIPYTRLPGPRSAQKPACRSRGAAKAADSLLAVFSQDVDEADEEWLPIEFSSAPQLDAASDFRNDVPDRQWSSFSSARLRLR